MGKWAYGVVLDAGSSGTRAYVYRWLKGEKAQHRASKQEAKELPVVQSKAKWAKKIRPGLSTFADNAKGIRKDYLDKLVKHVLKYVPDDEVEKTPLYLLATAGMRQLTLAQQKAIMSEACLYFREETEFRIGDCESHVQVIPGETEGLYGWIASNYLLGALNEAEDHQHGDGHHTYGFLEMGGASTQMAFVPNAEESKKHYDDLTLLRFRKVNGETVEYRVFVATWLGYGSTEARKRYVQSLLQAAGSKEEVLDPCLPKGLSATTDYEIIPEGHKSSNKEPHLVGTGDFAECMKKTYPLLNDNAPCPNKPCLMDGKHVPALDFDINHFVGVSRFHDIAHEIPELFGSTEAYDLHTYKVRVEEFCSQPWEAIVKSIEKGKFKKMTVDNAVESCFSASWLINMVHDGFDVPKADLDVVAGKLNVSKVDVTKTKHKGLLDPFQTVNQIHDTDVSWTLGTAVLLASSQVPASNTSLPVGYGPNAGLSWNNFIDPHHAFSDKEDDDWHDKLFSDSPRRVPGIFIFLLIIGLLLYFLFGRERRSSWYSKLIKSGHGHSPSRRRKFAGSKLFGFNKRSSDASYERVLEAGTAHSDFELGEIVSDDESYSDSSETSRRGRASGWATPQIALGGSQTTSQALGSPGYNMVDSNGLGASASIAQSMPGITSVLGRSSGRIGRSESKETLISRSESREKLFGSTTQLGPGSALALGHGRGSRAGSPTRMRSPLMSPLKESID